LSRNPPERIFFYGTLMKDHGRIGALIREGKLRFVAAGRIEARLYNVGDYPAAVPEKGGSVYGEVYEVSDLDEILPRLDEYEEYDASRPDDSLFIRKVTNVVLESGGEVPALVYFYNRDTEGLKVIRPGRWKK